MRALSLWQPWCSWMASGFKVIENRNWREPNAGRCLLGQDVALQAANHFDDDAFHFAQQHVPDLLPQLAEPRHGWPTGTILAVVKVEHVVRFRPGDLFAEEMGRLVNQGQVRPSEARWYMRQNVALVFRDIRKLAKPVPCGGFRRIGNLPPDVLRQVAAQVRVA